jgi:hypothetical protein
MIFKIEHLLKDRGITLNIPPCMSNEYGVKRNREFANLRIHVERAIVHFKMEPLPTASLLRQLAIFKMYVPC